MHHVISPIPAWKPSITFYKTISRYIPLYKCSHNYIAENMKTLAETLVCRNFTVVVVQ